MAFIYIYFFFLKKFEKVEKTGIISSKFSLWCTPSVILGMLPILCMRLRVSRPERKTQTHDYCDGVDDGIYKALQSYPGQNIREVWLSLITSFPLCPKISTQLRRQIG